MSTVEFHHAQQPSIILETARNCVNILGTSKAGCEKAYQQSVCWVGMAGSHGHQSQQRSHHSRTGPGRQEQQSRSCFGGRSCTRAGGLSHRLPHCKCQQGRSDS